MTVGNRIYELRKQHGLSQEQLAEKVGVARQTISKWEWSETSPDIKQASALSQVLGVSLDELLGSDTNRSPDTAPTRRASLPRKTLIAAAAAVVCLCVAAVLVFCGVKRWQILHPQGAESVIITRKSAVLIGRGGTASVVFCEDGKPTVACELPGGFASDTEMSGLYSDEDGNFVRFNADYSDNVINPLVGTEYYSYFVERGYDSYTEQANAAMYYGHPKWGIFAPKEKLYLAGGAKLIRQQLCAGQNADYYSLSGGLTENGDTMRIYGFALHFDNTVWLITLKDHNGIYYYVTIKDPNGIGKNIDTVGELLGSVAASE